MGLSRRLLSVLTMRHWLPPEQETKLCCLLSKETEVAYWAFVLLNWSHGSALIPYVKGVRTTQQGPLGTTLEAGPQTK